MGGRGGGGKVKYTGIRNVGGDVQVSRDSRKMSSRLHELAELVWS